MQTLLPSKFTGIIQLAPAEDGEVLRLQDLVLEQFPNHQPIGKLHITLLHQSYPKKVGAGKERGDKLLKALYKNGDHMSIQTPNVTFGDVHLAKEGERESSYVVINEQDLCLQTRDAILNAAGIDPTALGIDGDEASRKFHISLTNLTGNGGDSIAYPNPASDQRLEVK